MLRLLILVGILAALAAAPARADSLAEVRAGNAAFAEGRYEPAIEAYTRAILAGDLEPEALAVTFNNRGVAYGELGDYDRAIQDYNQALTLRPGDRTSIKNLRIGYARRASAHANLGEQDQALADYSKAIELEPQHAPTYVRRGQLRLERNEPELAAADLRKAQELDPANREAAELLARAETSLASATTPPQPAEPPPAAGAPDEPEVAAASPTSQELPPVTSTAPPTPAPAAGNETGTAAAPRAPIRVTPGEPRRFRAVQPVNFREGPGNDYPRTGSLDGGTEVNVVGESQGWLQIRLRSGKEGFVYRRFLEPVP
jgi:tetratricopeptide (TPR) repeat protein